MAVIGAAFGLILAPHAAQAYDPQGTTDGYVTQVGIRYQECLDYLESAEYLAYAGEKGLKYGIKDCDKQQKYALKDLENITKAYEKDGAKNPGLLDQSEYVKALDTLEQAYHDCIQQELRGKLDKPMKYDRKDLDKGRKYGAHFIKYSIKGKYNLGDLAMSPVPGTTETCETDGDHSIPDPPQDI
jgi:hypothetical protein